MIFRFTERRVGEHHHVGVFAAVAAEAGFEKLGELTMRPAEWRHFREMLIQGAGGDLSLHRDGAIDLAWTAD